MKREEVVVSPQQLARQREIMQEIRTHLQETLDHAPLACVDTFGCQQNVADSEHIMGMLREMGFAFTEDPHQADVVILNTCAVREHAEQRVYGNLGALTHTKKANPRQIICLCGCMAQQKQVADKVRASYRHVDLVFGPHALWRFPELLQKVYHQHGRVFSIDDSHGSIAEGLPIVREGGAKAWVSVMYGCNNFCTYCIVPYVRGRERSRDKACIVADVKSLIAEGYKEITLLGQNVNSYGKDLPETCDFADLLDELARLATHYGFLDQGTLVREVSAQELEAACRRCVRLTVTDAKTLCRVLDGRGLEYRLAGEGEADVYEAHDLSQLILDLHQAGCQVTGLHQRDETLESYYMNLVGGGRDV